MVVKVKYLKISTNDLIISCLEEEILKLIPPEAAFHPWGNYRDFYPGALSASRHCNSYKYRHCNSYKY